ncbi:hypothetical protein [Chamaesiphon sp.]|uniref:hypothetical protein n=1 Tax=Chamaesiphon sp. TaxID=2814140 RepID=UPI00359370E2
MDVESDSIDSKRASGSQTKETEIKQEKHLKFSYTIVHISSVAATLNSFMRNC